MTYNRTGLVVLIVIMLALGVAALARGGNSPLVITADLSDRQLVLTENGERILTARIAIGTRERPTPVGRFRIVGKYAGSVWNGRYGCCVLTLNTAPRGLTIALHGMRSMENATKGCLGLAERPLRRLMRLVPLGTQVVIHP